MLRRHFLQLGTLTAGLAAGQQQQTETVTASATEDKTPRVGIVPSSFDGSEDHDGTVIKRLADPQPVEAELSEPQIEAMARKAIELGNTRQGGLKAIVEAQDWVVIKVNISACHGIEAGPDYKSGTVTDLRVVRSLINYLAESKRGRRFTITEGPAWWQPSERSKLPVDGWTSEWGGAFGGLSYKKMVEDFSRRYPALKFELADLNFDETIEMPVLGGVSASRNANGTYHVPKTIQQCDRLISVAPLSTHRRTGVWLSIGNYWGIAPGSKYGFPKDELSKLGEADEVLVDLFSFHPADYAILGGCWGVEGDGPSGPGAKSVRYNLVIAGANAVAVDAVGAAVMGFNPGEIKHLDLAELNGHGIWDTDSIWVRGREIEQAQRPFGKPEGWKARS